jgi:pantoate--beta-alanine ligase
LDVITDKESLREQLQDWRQAGEHIALVPTMGNLHDGHLSLIEIARENAERVVVTVFVNPTQFGKDEDFEGYPRTLELDKRKVKRAKGDLLFVPDLETMYPFGIDSAASVTLPVLTAELCGEVRPGHFDGVTSVVTRLFGLVQPDVAVFGEKDYQQLAIIKRLVADMSLPVEVISGPTRREEDGLAMSSRNQYLDERERAIAPLLYKTLRDTAKALENGNRDYEALERAAIDALSEAGFAPEYVSIRRAESLEMPDRDTDELVVLGAAKLRRARLIDNVLVHV